MTKRAHQEAQRVKPLGEEGIEAIRKVMVEGYQKVNEVLVDAFSASAIIRVYDALNPANQELFRKMPVAKAADVSFKLLNRKGGAA